MSPTKPSRTARRAKKMTLTQALPPMPWSWCTWMFSPRSPTSAAAARTGESSLSSELKLRNFPPGTSWMFPRDSPSNQKKTFLKFCRGLKLPTRVYSTWLVASQHVSSCLCCTYKWQVSAQNTFPLHAFSMVGIVWLRSVRNGTYSELYHNMNSVVEGTP